MELVEVFPIKGRAYRFRATIRWGEKAAPIPLCSCRGGHISQYRAMECPKAKKELAQIRRDKEKG